MKIKIFEDESDVRYAWVCGPWSDYLQLCRNIYRSADLLKTIFYLTVLHNYSMTRNKSIQLSWDRPDSNREPLPHAAQCKTIRFSVQPMQQVWFKQLVFFVVKCSAVNTKNFEKRKKHSIYYPWTVKDTVKSSTDSISRESWL